MVDFSFEAIIADVAKLHAQLVDAHTTLPASPDREKLTQLIAQLEQGKADAEKAYPKYVDAMTKTMAETRDDALRMQQEATALKAKVEQQLADFEAAAKAGVAPPPVPPELAVDPALHKELGDELLERYGAAAVAVKARQELGSVHDIWIDPTDRAPITPDAVKAAPQPAPVPPDRTAHQSPKDTQQHTQPPTPSGDIWEDLDTSRAREEMERSRANDDLDSSRPSE
ncbi:hypothetical protein AYO40_03385 [Planctomycetaceae bacterium SCGC AG-212-D15]|nr:hypothetical protein AYO40_03385 [Planctomycetaceae bacterium SCGC AG-212-D15]